MRRLGLILLLIVLFLPAFPVQAAGRGDVLRIAYTSRAGLEQLTARLDVWEVHPGHVVAYVTPAQRAWLISEGVHFTYQASAAAQPAAIPVYPCYRTIVELHAQLEAWAIEAPELLHLLTIGQSYEGRPLYVAQLTNHARTGEKPVLFVMANIHGRELITPELAMVFIKTLLDGYDSDPDITWLLDAHAIYVLVSANPDGHVKNEAGQPWAYWRKNTNPTNGVCDDMSYGVDLNRNSSFKWGGAGSSADPCDELYRGPVAASEVETQAFQQFAATLFPDQRGPLDTDAASLDTSGVFITLHSYSNLVLWPWGHTTTIAPNGAQLERLGRKLAAYNGYSPGQAVGLYPTTGSSDDWIYGELGIAGYTFEIGPDFYPACYVYDALIQPNVRALLYAAKVARAPYRLPFGPDALAVTATPTTTLRNDSITITATLDERQTGGQNIAAAEAYMDTPPWAGGTPLPLSAADGAFNGAVETVTAQIPVGMTAAGRHQLFVRGRDAAGNWGPVSAAFFEVQPGVLQRVFLPLLQVEGEMQ